MSLWGSLIRNSIQDSGRNLLFTTISIMDDNEFWFEYGTFIRKDNSNHVKDEGRFIIVLKQEYGEWKFYRDNGL